VPTNPSQDCVLVEGASVGGVFELICVRLCSVCLCLRLRLRRRFFICSLLVYTWYRVFRPFRGRYLALVLLILYFLFSLWPHRYCFLVFSCSCCQVIFESSRLGIRDRRRFQIHQRWFHVSQIGALVPDFLFLLLVDGQPPTIRAAGEAAHPRGHPGARGYQGHLRGSHEGSGPGGGVQVLQEAQAAGIGERTRHIMYEES